MMKRTKLALAIFTCVLATLAIPAAAAPPSVDQATWSGLKKDIALPNGTRLAYVELGDPAGEPMLLLHGYTDTSRSWCLAAPYLSRYRLIIPDQRGHGDADAPRCCYSLSAFAEDAQLLLTALKIDRAAVAGHSLGSMVAMTMAAEYPDQVTALVLVGSTAQVPVKRGDWLYDSVAELNGPLDPASQFARDWHPANQPTPVDPAFAEAVNADLYKIPPHVWRAVLRELAEVPVGRHAADIRAPVLILSGGMDSLFPSPHHASLLKAFPEAETHVFPELGHNLNWEQPEAVAKRIDQFLLGRK